MKVSACSYSKMFYITLKVINLDDPEVKHGLQIISTCKSFRLGTRYGSNCYNVNVIFNMVVLCSTEEEKIQWMKVADLHSNI